jgi:cytochrome c55X
VRCSQRRATRAVVCDAPSRFSAVVGISSVAGAGAVLRHGVVQGFAGLGVHYGEGTVLDHLQVRGNAGVGIAGTAYATVGVLRAVAVEHNGGPGIVCEQMRIERSSFAHNGGTGVDCRGAWFIDSVSHHNGGSGVVEGRKHGLRSFGNRLPDEPGMAADRLPALDEPALASAWRTLRAQDCARCHGKTYQGSSGPSIVDYARSQSREMFVGAVLDGNPGRGMPGYRGNPIVEPAIDAIYRYFMQRADGTIAAEDRPASASGRGL